MKLTSSKQDYHLRRNMANASRCGKEGHFTRDCLENKEEVAKKNLNSRVVLKKGDQKHPRKGNKWKKRVKLRPMKTPDLNPDVMSHWIRCDTITWCKIEDNSCLALLDTGVTVNVITADYARMLDLPMGPLSDLREGLQRVKVPGNTFTGALGYVIVCIRFDKIKGYDEDQVYLAMEDNSEFALRVPVILGTPHH